MKPDHLKIIEAMVLAAEKESGAIPGAYMAMRAALRAAAERGWVMAKLPERKPYDFKETLSHKAMTVAHNYCLDTIETIEMEKSE